MQKKYIAFVLFTLFFIYLRAVGAEVIYEWRWLSSLHRTKSHPCLYLSRHLLLENDINRSQWRCLFQNREYYRIGRDTFGYL